MDEIDFAIEDELDFDRSRGGTPEPPDDLCDKIIRRVETTQRRERRIFLVKAVGLGLFAGSFSFFMIIYFSPTQTSPAFAGSGTNNEESTLAGTVSSSSSLAGMTTSTHIFFVKETQ